MNLTATPQAAALIRQLKEEYGPILFHQSGGCCDGSTPVCLRQNEFRVSSQDVLAGVVEDTPFYVGAAQYQYLAETPLVLDVAPGGEDSFSLEAAEGIRFVARSLNPPSEK
jgi:uncharacterized protein